MAAPNISLKLGSTQVRFLLGICTRIDWHGIWRGNFRAIQTALQRFSSDAFGPALTFPLQSCFVKIPISPLIVSDPSGILMSGNKETKGKENDRARPNPERSEDC